MTRRLRPTEDQRKTVKVMSGFGVPQPDIALFLGIDAKTLRKHFREELDRGTIEANVKVAQTLFNMATVDKNVAAAIFWMKARAGWREKHPEDDPSGAGGAAGTLVVRWDDGPELQRPTTRTGVHRPGPALPPKIIDHD